MARLIGEERARGESVREASGGVSWASPRPLLGPGGRKGPGEALPGPRDSCPSPTPRGVDVAPLPSFTSGHGAEDAGTDHPASPHRSGDLFSQLVEVRAHDAPNLRRHRTTCNLRLRRATLPDRSVTAFSTPVGTRGRRQDLGDEEEAPCSGRGRGEPAGGSDRAGGGSPTQRVSFDLDDRAEPSERLELQEFHAMPILKVPPHNCL